MSAVQGNVTIDTDRLSQDLSNMQGISNRLKSARMTVKAKIDVIMKANSGLASGLEEYYNEQYQFDKMIQDIDDMYHASVEAINRWKTYLEGWMQLDQELASDGSLTGDMSNPSLDSYNSSYNGSNISGIDMPGTNTWNNTAGRSISTNGWDDNFNISSLNNPNNPWNDTKYDNYDYNPQSIKDVSTRPTNIKPSNIKDFSGNFNTYGQASPYSVGDSSFSYGDTGSFGDYSGSGAFGSGLGDYSSGSFDGSANFGGYNGSGYGSSTLLSSASSAYYSSSQLSSYGSANLSSYSSAYYSSSQLSSYGSANQSSYSSSTYSSTGGGSTLGKGSGIGAGLQGAGQHLSSAINRGAAKLAKGLSPNGKLTGSGIIGAGTAAGLGLAAGGAAVAGGIILGGKMNYYTFTPEDFEKQPEEIQEAIIANFVNAGFSEDRIELFKNATFKIAAAEFNEHIKKVDKAYGIDTNLGQEIKDAYGFNIFKNDKIDNYLLFVAMIIDGASKTDEINIYNLVNINLDEDEVDFIYSGLNMEEYMVDSDLDDDEETEAADYEKDVEIGTNSWLEEMGIKE